MDAGSVASYRFGRFVLNLERGCLQQDGVDVGLRPKAFGLLRYLVEHAGRLASKSELVDAIWPNMAVSDDSVSQCILEIRKALGDHDRRLIKTVPRRGYVFMARVEADPALPEPGEVPQGVPSKAVGGSVPWQTVLAGLGVVVASAAAFFLLNPVSAPPPVAPLAIAAPTILPLLKASETVVGQPLTAYPAGVPVISAAIVPLAPGAESGWHTHPVPLFAYVLSGTVRVDYGTKGIRDYKTGDALIEAKDWPHNAINEGTTPASILVVYVGAEGVANSVAAGQTR